MNTINSVYYGWAFLICAGAGSYYFAKRSINADRAERQAMDNERKMRMNRQLALRAQFERTGGNGVPGAGSSTGTSTVGKSSASKTDPAGDPSREASADPAPTQHAGQGGSKYEASQPYRSPKGDRFS